MLMTDSYLFDAGWLFFGVWTVVVGVATVAAFGQDLIPFRLRWKFMRKTSRVGQPEKHPSR